MAIHLNSASPLVKLPGRRYLVAFLAVGALLLSACGDQAPTSTPGATEPTDGQEATDRETAADASSVKAAVVTSLSGPLQPYGEQFLAGVKAGVDYATNGSGEVNGRQIEIVEVDDASDTEQAVAAATDQIGQGVKIITGAIASGIALAQAPLAEQNEILYLSGPASTDRITGFNDYTFRPGRQTYQDVMTASSYIGEPEGKKILVFAQDTAYGESNVDSVTSVLGEQGAEVSSIMVPVEANDLTPFAADAAAEEADMVLVAWVGTDTSAAMWQALDQQGVFDVSTVASILDVASTYPVFYPEDVAPKIGFIGHYYPECCENDAAKALEERLADSDVPHDIYTSDGFNAGLMIVRAVSEGGDDVDAMISALEGWSFEGPKGELTIRAEDHALLQPMFETQMVVEGETYTPTLVDTLSADEIAPPMAED